MLESKKNFSPWFENVIQKNFWRPKKKFLYWSTGPLTGLLTGLVTLLLRSKSTSKSTSRESFQPVVSGLKTPRFEHCPGKENDRYLYIVSCKEFHFQFVFSRVSKIGGKNDLFKHGSNVVFCPHLERFAQKIFFSESFGTNVKIFKNGQIWWNVSHPTTHKSMIYKLKILKHKFSYSWSIVLDSGSLRVYQFV